VISLAALSFALCMFEISSGVRLGTAGRLFSVTAETSLPTWYAAVSIACASGLLLLIAEASRRKGARDVLAWAVLAALFAAISVDEIAMIHEAVGSKVSDLTQATGFLRYAWVIPAMVVVPVVGALFLPFLGRLSKRRRFQFVSAGVIYVTGALVMEMVGAKTSEGMAAAPGTSLYSATEKMITPAYAVCFHLEELLELVGIALFNSALVEHLAGLLGSDGLRIRVRE
jgi:hypothetical protein